MRARPRVVCLLLSTLSIAFPVFSLPCLSLCQRHTFYFHSPEWDAVSPEAKDLISRLLHRDPQQRLSAREALAHAWFEKEKEELEDRELPAAKEGIEKFNALRWVGREGGREGGKEGGREGGREGRSMQGPRLQPC